MTIDSHYDMRDALDATTDRLAATRDRVRTLTGQRADLYRALVLTCLRSGGPMTRAGLFAYLDAEPAWVTYHQLTTVLEGLVAEGRVARDGAVRIGAVYSLVEVQR